MVPRSVFPSLLTACRFHGARHVARRGREAKTGVHDPVIIMFGYHAPPVHKQLNTQALTSNSELSKEAVSAFTFRFRYGRDGTISPSSLLWYRCFRLRDQRSIANANMIVTTAAIAAETPDWHTKVGCWVFERSVGSEWMIPLTSNRTTEVSSVQTLVWTATTPRRDHTARARARTGLSGSRGHMVRDKEKSQKGAEQHGWRGTRKGEKIVK